MRRITTVNFCCYVEADWLAFAFTLFALAVPGCSSHSPSITSVQTSQRNVSAVPTVGDTADYTIAGEIQMATGLGSGKGVACDGHKTITVTQAANHGRSFGSYIKSTWELRTDSVQTLGGLNESSAAIVWHGADASGNIYLLGRSPDGVSWDVVTDAEPPVCIPSELKPGTTWQYTAHFGSGSIESSAESCIGAEEVKTPAGTFPTLKVSCNLSKTAVRGANVNLNGHTWACSGTPHAVEVKSDNIANMQLQGATFQSHIVTTLQSYHCAR